MLDASALFFFAKKGRWGIKYWGIVGNEGFLLFLCS
jgi:hypothetical protein